MELHNQLEYDFTSSDSKPPQLRMAETTPEALEALGIGPAEAIEYAVPPSAVSFRDRMTGVRNQAAAPACTAFCTLSLLEFVARKDLSESHLVHSAERKCGDCKDAFNQFACAMSTARDLGVCEEAYWGYDDKKVCWTSPPNIAGKPLSRFSAVSTLFTQARVEVLSTMDAFLRDGGGEAAPPGKSATLKKHLSARRTPVGVELPVFWKAGWQNGPDINMPRRADFEDFMASATPTVDGWHCVAFCGYDDGRSRFLFKNSWGTVWGDRGYGTVPYEYVDRLSASAMIGS